MDVDGVGWGEYLRVRITLDLSKPLAREKLNGDSTWIAFQYKRLPKFYFLCGVIRHGVGGCWGRKGPVIQGVGSQVQFGTWLRASSSARRPGLERRGFSFATASRMNVDGKTVLPGHAEGGDHPFSPVADDSGEEQRFSVGPKGGSTERLQGYGNCSFEGGYFGRFAWQRGHEGTSLFA